MYRSVSIQAGHRIVKYGIILCAVLILGCGRGGAKMVQVVGKVTYRGGACPGPGTVMLAPYEVTGGSGLRPASAEFGDDGAFAVRSFRPGDGLKPGRYRITIQCWKERPQGYDKPGVDVVRPGFHPEDLVVAPDSPRVELHYDIP